MGSAHRISAPYQVIRCQDKPITLGDSNQADWECLCSAFGREELMRDLRYLTGPLRRQHYQELADELETIFATKSATCWLARRRKAHIPCGPIYDMAEVYADAQVQARETVVELSRPNVDPVKSIGIPVKFSEIPSPCHARLLCWASTRRRS